MSGRADWPLDSLDLPDWAADYVRGDLLDSLEGIALAIGFNASLRAGVGEQLLHQASLLPGEQGRSVARIGRCLLDSSVRQLKAGQQRLDIATAATAGRAAERRAAELVRRLPELSCSPTAIQAAGTRLRQRLGPLADPIVNTAVQVLPGLFADLPSTPAEAPEFLHGKVDAVQREVSAPDPVVPAPGAQAAAMPLPADYSAQAAASEPVSAGSGRSVVPRPDKQAGHAASRPAETVLPGPAGGDAIWSAWVEARGSRQAPALLVAAVHRYAAWHDEPAGACLEWHGGRGGATRYLLRNGWRVHALTNHAGVRQTLLADLPTEQGRRLHVQGVSGSAVPSGFDLLWMENVPAEQSASSVLRQVRRSLRAGGLLALTTDAVAAAEPAQQAAALLQALAAELTIVHQHLGAVQFELIGRRQPH